MSETTTSASTAATKAAKTIAAASPIPSVVETVEVAMEMPAKVVLNQKLVVIASVAGGVAVGAVGLWGANKLRSRLALRKLNAKVNEAAEVEEVS